MAREDLDMLTQDVSGMREVSDAQADLASTVSAAQQEESALYENMSPRGKFSKSNLGGLTRVLNKVVPLFGLEMELEAPAEDMTMFPEDHMRVVAMVMAAANDAAAADVIDSSAVPALDEVTDDTSLRLLGAKIETLAKDKEFKRFLKEPLREEELAVEVEPVEEVEVADDEDLFLNRM